MGLFGGFKAKLTGFKNPKEKPVKGVVPLNFRFKSEFSTDNPSTEISKVVIRNKLQSRPVIRSATFDDNTKELREKLKSRSLINIINQPTLEENYDEPKNPYERKTNSFKEGSRPSQEKFIKNSIYPGATGSVHQYEEINNLQSIKEDTPSTSLKMAQHEPEQTTNFPKINMRKILKNKEEPIKNSNQANNKHSLLKDSYTNNKSLYSDDFKINNIEQETNNRTKDSVKTTSYETDDDDFKVNIVEHNRYYTSEDDLSYTEDESSEEYKEISSQAASIFFGSTIATPPMRPRKIALLPKEDEDVEEIDC